MAHYRVFYLDASHRIYGGIEREFTSDTEAIISLAAELDSTIAVEIWRGRHMVGLIPGASRLTASPPKMKFV